MLYTGLMTDYGRFLRKPRAIIADNELLRRKRARQAVLKRVKKQRAIAAKKLVGVFDH
jgi:hypothetical protein